MSTTNPQSRLIKISTEMISAVEPGSTPVGQKPRKSVNWAEEVEIYSIPLVLDSWYDERYSTPHTWLLQDRVHLELLAGAEAAAKDGDGARSDEGKKKAGEEKEKIQRPLHQSPKLHVRRRQRPIERVAFGTGDTIRPSARSLGLLPMDRRGPGAGQATTMKTAQPKLRAYPMPANHFSYCQPEAYTAITNWQAGVDACLLEDPDTAAAYPELELTLTSDTSSTRSSHPTEDMIEYLDERPTLTRSNATFDDFVTDDRMKNWRDVELEEMRVRRTHSFAGAADQLRSAKWQMRKKVHSLQQKYDIHKVMRLERKLLKQGRL
ncbi:hypothetical protein ACN47E_006648 [Coniothyrium glycines]